MIFGIPDSTNSSASIRRPRNAAMADIVLVPFPVFDPFNAFTWIKVPER
jgi:hypothetical protein